ncbi:hypothetical protein [Streptomyces goshikiensis]|uniref:hypothetical protein n=1 Tax=Streptomyces goshikiensis TaxID=1942 RepID=UPI00365BC833
MLEPAGAVRLSVDEVVHDGCGRYGLDYPKNTYFEKEAPVVAELQERLVELVAEGVNVVWDHGLPPRKNRPGRLWQPPSTGLSLACDPPCSVYAAARLSSFAVGRLVEHRSAADPPPQCPTDRHTQPNTRD